MLNNFVNSSNVSQTKVAHKDFNTKSHKKPYKKKKERRDFKMT